MPDLFQPACLLDSVESQERFFHKKQPAIEKDTFVGLVCTGTLWYYISITN